LKADLKEHDILCWRDADEIPAGASWNREIETALSSCSHILVIVSQHSIESQNVADEIGYAKDRKKAIIPILLDKSLLPLRVYRTQAIDFQAGYTVSLEKLLASIGGVEDKR